MVTKITRGNSTELAGIEVDKNELYKRIKKIFNTGITDPLLKVDIPSLKDVSGTGECVPLNNLPLHDSQMRIKTNQGVRPSENFAGWIVRKMFNKLFSY